MNICIDWTKMTKSNRDYRRVLYANVDYRTKKILYIGKADSCSGKGRTTKVYQSKLQDYLFLNGTTTIASIVGDIILEENRELSHELLSDIESLFIKRLKPIANAQSKMERISRPGMKLICKGAWPHPKHVFLDVDH